MVTVTILTPESSYDTTAWPDAVRHATAASEGREHAELLLQGLLALLPVAPAVSNINRFSNGFEGRFGVELVMATVLDDLVGVRDLIGGHLLIEAETTIGGTPCLRHTLTGTKAGVPFAVWTTVYPHGFVSAA